MQGSRCIRELHGLLFRTQGVQIASQRICSNMTISSEDYTRRELAETLKNLPEQFSIDSVAKCAEESNPSITTLFDKVDPNRLLKLLENARTERRPLFVAAPMVRYSKLPFRLLLRHFNVHAIYTPMMIAREFHRSPYARNAEYSSCKLEATGVPIIAQFGASGADDLSLAVDKMEPFVSAFGINCGCPIRDQNQAGIGAALLNKPETIVDMVRTLKERNPSIVIDVKIRLQPDLSKTYDLVRRLSDAGVDIITVHGRTKAERNSVIPNYDAIRTIREIVPSSIYVIANGDCFTLADAHCIVSRTGADGVMSARGLLANPALFAGYDRTPWKAVEIFCAYASFYGGVFRHLQFILAEMTLGLLTKQERSELRLTTSWTDLILWLNERFILRSPTDPDFATAEYDNYRR
ncbi:hypothetical protein V1511DRAFT_503359 [Dipodascopsis uninucleata]